MLPNCPHRSTHFEENIKSSYDSSNFPFLPFYVKIIVNRVISYVLVIIRFRFSMAPCKTVYTGCPRKKVTDLIKASVKN